MELKEFQKRAVKIVDDIDSKQKGKHDIDTTLAHLVEEFGEIAREIYNEKIGRDKTNLENLKGEFADVYILLAKLASNFDIDLEEAINGKIEILKKRHNLD